MASDNRVKWVDTARFMGIFMIYIVHFFVDPFLSFVDYYAVRMLVLIAGCTAVYDMGKPLKQFVCNKIKSLLLPYLFLSIITVAVHCLAEQDWWSTKQNLLIILSGAPINHSYVYQLWFLSALFVVEIVFKLMYDIIKNKWAILAICAAISFIAYLFIPTSGLFFNVDMAAHHIMFFAIGFFAYPGICSLFEKNTKVKRLVFYISLITALSYSVLCFKGTELIVHESATGIIGFITTRSRALVISWATLTIASLLKNVELFNEIGRNSLWFFGNEAWVKTATPAFFSIFGVHITTYPELVIVMYVVFLFAVQYRWIVPFEKKVYKSLTTL